MSTPLTGIPNSVAGSERRGETGGERRVAQCSPVSLQVARTTPKRPAYEQPDLEHCRDCVPFGDDLRGEPTDTQDRV